MDPRIIYYYQTFDGLDGILHKGTPVTHIHLSSIHFGYLKETKPEENERFGKPYIHLNDKDPEDSAFDKVWDEVERASALGIKVALMVGGAGGAYKDLFDNFDVFYPMLLQVFADHSFLSGINLDIEEPVTLSQITMLIDRLSTDLDAEISMAPLSGSLATDGGGMGGFSYKDLWTSPAGAYISYFNGQFYGSFSVETFEACVANGYPPHAIVMGCLAPLSEKDEKNVYETLESLAKKYKIGGAFLWEYFEAPKDWAPKVKKALTPSTLSLELHCG